MIQGRVGLSMPPSGSKIMVAYCKEAWDRHCADQRFLDYVEACRRFDPEGFERALRQDEVANSFDFRRVILEAYAEDSTHH